MDTQFMSSGALSNLIFYIGYIFNNSTLKSHLFGLP